MIKSNGIDIRSQYAGNVYLRLVYKPTCSYIYIHWKNVYHQVAKKSITTK